MTREYLLDASALLAVLLGEPGQERVLEVLDRSFIHSVNVAEVIARLIRSGVPPRAAEDAVEQLQLETEQTSADAAACGELLGARRDLGLSLGDCVCLATAARSGAVALTTDRAWAQVSNTKLRGRPLRVEVIR